MVKKIFYAPLQGFTEAPYRTAHQFVYSGEGEADSYFMPFTRVEKGEIRPKDIRELEVSVGLTNQVPQAIFNGPDELTILLRTFAQYGFKSINLNCGCPFPPQVNGGRGAGVLLTSALGDIRSLLTHYYQQGMRFSLKMRLGVTKSDEWKKAIKYINDLPLDYVILHPRTAAQRYGGNLISDALDEFLGCVAFPVVFNGDIKEPEDVEAVWARWPELYGVMIGRGALGRPSIFQEIRTGCRMSEDEKNNKLVRLYRLYETNLSERLCGETQLLSKLKPFWEYLEPEIGRKAFKAIRKAGTLSKYRLALAESNLQ